MKMNLSPLILFTLLAACTLERKVETSIQDTTQTVKKSGIENPTEQKRNNETKATEKVLLNKHYLTEFAFLLSIERRSALEVLFDPEGKFKYYDKIDGNETIGSWQLPDSVIQIAIGEDTISLYTQSITNDALTLITDHEAAGRMFKTTRLDWGEYKGYYSIELHRVMFSAPYPQNLVADSWQVYAGACDFREDGTFLYSEADCELSASWRFDGQNFNIKFSEEDCNWSRDVGATLTVMRLSKSLMITQNPTGDITVFWRAY